MSAAHLLGTFDGPSCGDLLCPASYIAQRQGMAAFDDHQSFCCCWHFPVLALINHTFRCLCVYICRWRSRRNKSGAANGSISAADSNQQQSDKFWGPEPSQALLPGPSSGASSINSSPQLVSFYQRPQQQQHQVVYGFSPEPQQQQQQQSWEAAGSRPPRPAGAISPEHHQQLLRASNSSGGVPGGAQRTGSFSWLEDAIVEWQTAQGHLAGDSHAAGAISSSLRPTAAAPAASGGVSGSGVAGGAGGYSSQQVEEVKLVLRLLPVFATTVIYW